MHMAYVNFGSSQVAVSSLILKWLPFGEFSTDLDDSKLLPYQLARSGSSEHTPGALRPSHNAQDEVRIFASQSVQRCKVAFAYDVTGGLRDGLSASGACLFGPGHVI